ncbi:MAG: type 1 glutamine amidotransferase [Ktedonobacteraceae bacterium]
MVQNCVLVLQHIEIDPAGYLGDLLQEHSIPYDVVMVQEGMLPDPAAYGAILSLGGPEYAGDEELPYLVQEKALIHHAVEQDIPFLGICLGGQLLASALGAPIIRKGLTEIGFFDAQFTVAGMSDPLFAGLPGYQHMFHWHEDTFTLPEGARRLAVRPDAPEQAFRYGKRAYGLQYHIELTPDMLVTWVRHHPWRDQTIELLGLVAYEGIEQEAHHLSPPYCDHTRTLFENFLTLSSLL